MLLQVHTTAMISFSYQNDGLIQLSWSDENTRFEKTVQYNHLNTNGHLATLNTDTSAAIYGWIR